MPLNQQQLAQLRANPAAVLQAAQQAEIEALAGGNVPVQLPGMTLADIENELRERARRAEGMGDHTIVRTTESAIAMNRQFMGAVAGGMVALQNQVNNLQAQVNGGNKVIEAKPKRK